MKVFYKIINTLATLTLIPVLLFLPMFRFIAVVGANSSNQLLSLLGGMLDINEIINRITGIDIENLPEFYTIPEVIDLFTGEAANGVFSQIDASYLPEAAINSFMAAGILFAFALLCAVIIIVIGLFTKKKLVAASFAGLGFLSTFAANKCFTFVAEQFVSGKISVSQILSKLEAFEKYAKYVDMINFDIRIFELGSAYTMMLVIFGALALLSVGFYLAESTT